MAKSNADKQERNDIYTAFAVLGLFLLFGFFIYRLSGNSEELETVWLEQPETPSGYHGYPYPHDDESIKRIDIAEEIAPLPRRTFKPVTSAINEQKPVSNLMTAPTESPVELVPTTTEREVIIESSEDEIEDDKVIVAVQEAVEPVIEKVTPTPAPVVKQKPEPLAEVKTPKRVEKPKVSKPVPAPKTNDVKAASGMNYITSSLPCVWVVGIFKNPGNVNRVVARLRLNKFEVATGAHEKGTYVGVPCACSKDDGKQAQLREIFAAQPWLLRK